MNNKPSSRLTRCPGYTNLQSISETRTVTHEQLVNEVKGINARLAMAEDKCVEIESHKSSRTGRQSDKRRQVPTSLH
jgi:hypothetical protein